MVFTKDNNGQFNFFTQTKRNNIDIDAQKVTDAINGAEVKFGNLLDEERTVTKATNLMNEAFENLSPTLTEGVADTGDFTEAQKKLQENVTNSKTSIKSFSSVMSGFKNTAKSVIATLGNFAIILLINLAISGIAQAIESASKKAEEAAEEAKKLDEKSKSLASTQQQVLELRKKLDDVNISESEALSIRKQLYGIQDDLIEQYGAEARQIDLVRDSVDSLNNSFEGLNTTELGKWYSENASAVSDSIKDIYGKDSIGSSFNIAGFGINSGSERISLNEDINSYDRMKIEDIFTNQIGGDKWGLLDPGRVDNGYIVKIGEAVKEAGGTKKDLVDKYDKIISKLQDLLKDAQNNGRETNGIEDIISQFSNAKKYWADENYENELANANKYAQYLVSQNSEQNKAYNALQMAKTDYDNSLQSGSEEAIKSAYDNYNSARTVLKEMAKKLGETGNDGAVKDFLQGIVDDANSDLAKEDFKLKFEANENNLKTSLEDAVKKFGNGNKVYADDIINYKITDKNIGTDASNAFSQIKIAADGEEMPIKTLVEWLTELGVVEKSVSETSKNLEFADILNTNADSIKSATDELSKIQSAFSTIKDVISDYNDTGILSIDNMQKLIALGDDYIGCLFDEKGNLSLNEQAYQQLNKAKLDSIKMDILKNAIDNIKQITDEASAQEYLAQKINDTTTATKGYTEEILKSYVADGIAQGGKVKEAVLDIFNTYKKYVTLIDNTDLSLKEFSGSTEKQTTALDNQKAALENLKEAQEAEKKRLEDQKKALEDLLDKYKDDKDAIEDLISLTADYVKQTYEDKIQALEDEKDAYKEKIEASKEAIDALENELDAEKDLHDYRKSISEKTNDISTTKKQIAALQNSTSVSDRKKLQELKNQLSEQQQDLADYQYNQSVDNRKDALENKKKQLDEQYNHKEELLNTEIDKIHKVVDNERQIRTEAMNLIDSRSNKFYNDLWNYVYQYTTISEASFNRMWNSAYTALEKYGWGQFNCMYVLQQLEIQTFNVEEQIQNMNAAIDNTNSAIDNVSNRISNLSSSVSGYSSAISQLNSAISNTALPDLPQTYEIYLRGARYSVTASGIDEAATKFRDKYYDFLTKQERNTDWLKQNLYIPHYAKGTSYARGGFAIVDESGTGSELIMHKTPNGRFTYLEEGSFVLNKEQMQKLYTLTENPSVYLNENMQKSFGNIAKLQSIVNNNNVNSQTVNPVFNINISSTLDNNNLNTVYSELKRRLLEDFVRIGKYYG